MHLWQCGWRWLTEKVESLFHKELNPQLPSTMGSFNFPCSNPGRKVNRVCEWGNIRHRWEWGYPSENRGFNKCLQDKCWWPPPFSPLFSLVPRKQSQASTLQEDGTMIARAPQWATQFTPQSTPHWQEHPDFLSESECPTASYDQTLRDQQTPEESPWDERQRPKQARMRQPERYKRILGEKKLF